jgi:hypothetical protein
MTKVRPSFAVVPVLAAGGFFSMLVTLPLDFPFFSLYQSYYLPHLIESTALGLASASVLLYFRILRTWARSFAVVSTFIVAHLLGQVLDPYLPAQVTPCLDCPPKGFFTTEVALRFLLLSVVIFIVCVGLIAPRPKLPSCLLASIGSACLGSVVLGFLDSRSEWAYMSLVVNGRPLGILWQLTLVFFLGIAVWGGPRLAIRGSLPLQASAGPEAQTRLPNPYVGFGVFGVFLLLMGTWGGVISRREAKATNESDAQVNSQMARSRQEAPPMASLPASHSLRPEEVMVIENLGDWKIFRSESHHLDAISGEGSGVFPEREKYNAAFARKGDLYSIEVEITQYPNKDWARYELRNTPRANALYEDRLAVHQLARFAGTVYQDAPNFYWSSEDKVIRLNCDGVPPVEIDPFLKAYLLKYPSSVQSTNEQGQSLDHP